MVTLVCGTALTRQAAYLLPYKACVYRDRDIGSKVEAERFAAAKLMQVVAATVSQNCLTRRIGFKKPSWEGLAG